jgi:hypothetical protein
MLIRPIWDLPSKAKLPVLGLAAIVVSLPLLAAKCPAQLDQRVSYNVQRQLVEGKQIFRYDTFGDQDFWGGQLRLHESVATLSPNQAFALGLKVDVDALPPVLVQQLLDGNVPLDDPAVTLSLLKRNAVVGVTGFFSEDGTLLTSVGIQCALCHSTVDDTTFPGIGHRLDGWANRDLNVGAIVASAPTVKPFADALEVSEDDVRTVLNAWGPGKFDALLILDGKGFRPDKKTGAVLIPPAFGMAGVNLHTSTGAWGNVSYWNAFVANLEMHGQGTFVDERLNNPDQFPVATRNGFFDKRDPVDLISSKLPALHMYQLAIPAPKPPVGSFDAKAAERGKVLFNGKSNCASCHVPPTFSEPGWNLHTPEEMGLDSFQADRSPDRRYRTAPLAGLWTHQKGGFFHDGRFNTLDEVVEFYNTQFALGLTTQEKLDLVQFLLSI